MLNICTVNSLNLFRSANGGLIEYLVAWFCIYFARHLISLRTPLVDDLCKVKLDNYFAQQMRPDCSLSCITTPKQITLDAQVIIKWLHRFDDHMTAYKDEFTTSVLMELIFHL